MKILVIGLGSMGRRRIRLIQRIYPEYELLGVDMKQERRQTCEDEYHIRTKEDLPDALRESGIDCAFVCTSPLSHADIIEKCLLNYINVFTEINLVADKYLDNMKLAANSELLLFLSSTPIYLSLIHI